MKRLTAYLILVVCMIPCARLVVWAQDKASEAGFAKYCDTFDRFDENRWRPVLQKAHKPGTVTCERGVLRLKSVLKQPYEMQVLSRFCLKGDFDLRVSYEVPGIKDLAGCRISGGIVLQTPRDTADYECFVVYTPSKGMFYRTRLDRPGAVPMEIGQKEMASTRGQLRVKRQRGRITCYAAGASRWEEIYSFKAASEAPMRVCFKLQTGDTKSWNEACPSFLGIDEFFIQFCKEIIPD